MLDIPFRQRLSNTAAYGFDSPYCLGYSGFLHGRALLERYIEQSARRNIHVYSHFARSGGFERCVLYCPELGSESEWVKACAPYRMIRDHFAAVFLLSLSNICAGANDSEKLEEPGDAMGTQDSYGESSLITAARQGYLANVKALLSHGADKSLKNDDGKTAYDRISSLDEEEFKALLVP